MPESWRDPGAGNKPNAEKKKQELYVKYVIASQKYIRGLVKSAESMEKDGAEQKAMGEKVVSVIEGWIK